MGRGTVRPSGRAAVSRTDGRVRLVCAGAAMAAVLLIGACSGGGDTPAPASAAPTSAPTNAVTPTPTPSPSVTDVGVPDRSDPALGIVFEKIPDVSGSQADALDTLMQFQVEFWRSRIDGALSSSIGDLSTGAALAQVKEVVSTNEKNGWTTAGETTSTYTDIAGTSKLVIVDMCTDERDVTYTKDGKVTSGAELATAQQKIRAEVAQQPTGVWAVQTFTPGDPC